MGSGRAGCIKSGHPFALSAVALPAVALALVALTGTALLAAPPAMAQTLTDTLVTAYTVSPVLDAARARQRATDEGVPRALSGWRPNVSLTGQAGRAWEDLRVYSTNGATVFQPDARNPYNAYLNVRQSLYAGGRTTADVARSEALVLQGRAGLVGTEQSVFLDALSAHVDVVRDRRVLDLQREGVEVFARQLQAVQRRRERGDVTTTDVAQAEARHAQAIADFRAAQGNLEISRANFLRIVGVAPPEPLAQPAAASGLPATLAAAQALARTDNPQVQSAQIAMDVARHDVSLVQGERLPTVDLVGQAGRDEQYSNQVGRDIAQVTVQVAAPLYTGGATEARIRSAKQTLSSRIGDHAAAVLVADNDCARGWYALESNRARIVAVTEQVRAARAAVVGYEAEVRGGTRSVIDQLNAEQDRLNAEVALVRAQREEIFASYQLLAAVGRLNVPAMNLPTQPYDATAYYRAVRNKWWYDTDIQ